MKSAYGGSILYVNLSDSSYRIEETTQLLKEQYLGGNGFGVKLITDLVKPGIDPLSPDNVLVFAVGPTTGTIIPCSSRFGVFSKSPLTGLFFDSYCGGTWGEQLKKAGFDALVIQGQAEAPISIVIDNYKVSFKRAVDLWGENTFNTQKKLLTQVGDGFTIATIGPAGENLVRYAGIIAETRAAGRGGMGAVMGSKRLKAIAVRGNKDIEVQDPKILMDYVYNLNERIKKHPGTGNVLPNLGTSVGAITFNDLGILGSYNWQQEIFKGAEKISGEYMKRKKIYRKTKACLHCPIRCSKIAKGRTGLLQEYVTDGPEFETVYSLGSLCGNDDINSIIAGDRICDELGLDTISVGAVLSFIMECHMRDILPSDVTDMVNQLGIRFGKLENIVKILYTIANREGIGDLLAEGTQRMADQFGDEAQKVCVAVKGLEISGHTARGAKGMGLGYAVATRGGTHQDARPTLERSGKYDPYTIEGKGKLIKDNQDMTAVGDSLIVCRYTEPIFGFFINEDFVTIANLTTGFSYSMDGIREVGERIYTLERLFNVREGIDRSKDTLPYRFINEPIPDGPRKGMHVTKEELQMMLNDYYKSRGWDIEKGIPTQDLLNHLSIS